MIKQWLQRRRDKKYAEQYDKGYAWALEMIRLGENPRDVSVVALFVYTLDSYRDGAIACCKHHR